MHCIVFIIRCPMQSVLPHPIFKRQPVQCWCTRLLLSLLFVFSNSTSSWYTLRTLCTLRNYSSSPSYFCLDLIVGEHSYGCHGYSCVLIVLSCSWLLSLPFLLVVWCHCSFFTCSNVPYIFHFCNIPFKGALLKEVTQDYLFQPHYSSVG